VGISWSGVELLTLVFVWSGAMYRMPCSVDVSPLLKTAGQSLYEILYFAVLLDHCLMDINSICLLKTFIDLNVSICKNQAKYQKSETCMSKPHQSDNVFLIRMVTCTINDEHSFSSGLVQLELFSTEY
jgi:hypothetical protein